MYVFDPHRLPLPVGPGFSLQLLYLVLKLHTAGIIWILKTEDMECLDLFVVFQAMVRTFPLPPAYSKCRYYANFHDVR